MSEDNESHLVNGRELWRMHRMLRRATYRRQKLSKTCRPSLL